MDNLAEQCEEIEALVSIYDKSFRTEAGTSSYSIQINSDVKLYMILNAEYPSRAPPQFELLAPTLNKQQKQQVHDEFRKIHETNQGAPILYLWIEKLKDIVNITQSDTTNEMIDNYIQENTNEFKDTNNLLQVTHGEIIQDRKSVFQGHASPVFSQLDVNAFLSHLKTNKKIAQATHNISAYRIVTNKGAILQDCDDDGEAHAGGRMLHLLQILDVKNVMVVVSRWYGGVHLGPDRFKHINNAARQVLLQGGFLPT